MTDAAESIDIRLVGGGISPTKVRIETLFGVLGALEAAIENMAEHLGVEFEDHEFIVRPDGYFQESSLLIQSQINPKAAKPLQEIDRAFFEDDVDNLPDNVRARFLELQGVLARRGCDLELSGTSLRGLKITKDMPSIKSPTDRLEMTSNAVVYGVCTRINRAKRDARLDTFDGHGCTLTGLNDNHVRVLMRGTGENLEQVYRIQGEATWKLGTYRVTKMTVSSIELVQSNAEEFFEFLQKSISDSFDNVDPIAYVNDLRGRNT